MVDVSLKVVRATASREIVLVVHSQRGQVEAENLFFLVALVAVSASCRLLFEYLTGRQCRFGLTLYATL
jgi:hypothetical protein